VVPQQVADRCKPRVTRCRQVGRPLRRPPQLVQQHRTQAEYFVRFVVCRTCVGEDQLSEEGAHDES
jgi:hypothetical protein